MTTAAAEPDGIGGGFCRVQIAGPTTRVDLAVPTAVPLAALLPSIVSFAEQDAAAPQGWALSRLDGARLDPAAALTVAGIREGELLLLHPARDRVGEPLYDDVVEVLGEGAAESGWSPRETRAAAAVLGVLAVLGAVWAGVTVGTPLAGVLLGVLTLLLLGGGAAMSHAAGDVPAGTVLGALAALTGAAFGVVLLGPPFGAAHVVVAAAVAVLVAATGPALVDGGDAVFVGLGLTALLALLGGALVLLAGATPARAAAVVAPLALALTTAAPTRGAAAVADPPAPAAPHRRGPRRGPRAAGARPGARPGAPRPRPAVRPRRRLLRGRRAGRRGPDPGHRRPSGPPCSRPS